MNVTRKHAWSADSSVPVASARSRSAPSARPGSFQRPPIRVAIPQVTNVLQPETFTALSSTAASSRFRASELDHTMGLSVSHASVGQQHPVKLGAVPGSGHLDSAGPDFILPRGTAPVGVPNRQVFQRLVEPGADLSWILHSTDYGGGGERVVARVEALLTEGPFLLTRDEPARTQRALRAYGLTSFHRADVCWLHYFRLFLASLQTPQILPVARMQPDLTNGVVAHVLRMDHASSSALTLQRPRSLKKRSFEILSRWKLKEADLIAELLMSSGVERAVTLKPGAGLLRDVGALLQATPSITSLRLMGAFTYGRITGQAVGLQSLLLALDHSCSGTANLATIDLSARVRNQEHREAHWSSLATLMVQGVPRCRTLREVVLRDCSKLGARVLLPAVAKMILTAPHVTTLRLLHSSLPFSKDNSGAAADGPQNPCTIFAGGIGAAPGLTSLDLSGCKLVTNAATLLARSFYHAKQLQQVKLHRLRVSRTCLSVLIQSVCEMASIDPKQLCFPCRPRRCGAATLDRSVDLDASSELSTSMHNESDNTRAAVLGVVEGIGLRRESLRSINVSNLGLGVDGAVSLASACQACRSLCSLNIAGNGINSVGANALAQALQGCASELEELVLSDNDIGDSAAHALSSLLRQCPKISVIKLDGNCFTNDGVALLWNALYNTNFSREMVHEAGGHIATLDFSHNKIDSCHSISQAYRCGGPAVAALYLSHNHLGATSARVFADIISLQYGANDMLTELDLSFNKGIGAGAAALGKALARAPSLLRFSVAGCKLGSDGTWRLAKGLCANEKLEAIDLSDNLICCNLKSFNLELRAVDQLASAVQLNKSSLKELHLARNELGKSGLSLLQGALEHNEHLTILDLSGNKAGAGCLEAIQRIVTTNMRYSKFALADQAAVPVTAKSTEDLGATMTQAQRVSVTGPYLAAHVDEDEHFARMICAAQRVAKDANGDKTLGRLAAAPMQTQAPPCTASSKIDFGSALHIVASDGDIHGVDKAALTRAIARLHHEARTAHVPGWSLP